MIEHNKYKGHIAVFLAQIIFGISNPVAKTLMLDGQMDGLALAFFRIGGAAVLFWLVSPFFPKEKVMRKDLWGLLGAGLFAVVLNQIPFIVGLSYTTTITASLLVMLTPILTMFGAAWVLKEPITTKKAFGVLLGMSGAALLVIDGKSSGQNSVWGILLCLISCLSFATYLTVFKNLITRYSSITLMKWMFLFAVLLSAPFCYKSIVAVPYSALDINAWLRIAYVVGFATFIAYLLIPVGQKVLRPTTVSMYNYTQPLVTALLSAFLGIGVFGWKMGVAALLVFAGVYVVTQSKSRAQVEAEKKQIAD